MVADELMGDLEGFGAFQGGLLQQKGGQTLVKALPHDLFHPPHHLGEAGGHDVVGEIGDRCGLLHHLLVDLRGDNPKLRLLLCLNDDLELNAPHDAGSGKQADVPLKQTVKRHFPSLVRENVGP